jgi:DNA-binding response OmpR family regulator
VNLLKCRMINQIALYIDRSSERQMYFCQSLEVLGLKVYMMPTIKIAKNIVKQFYPHVTIMHFNTVGKEIFSFCSFLRFTYAHAIVIVLMEKARISIEERLFDCGASDVVTGEETSPRILVKRIKTHLQRSDTLPSTTAKVKLGDAIVDFHRREVWCNGDVRPLPGILADLLKYFLDNADHVISRNELMKSPIWFNSICTPPEEGGKTFDVNVSKLRKIIESNPSKPKIIKSVRGIGWKLETQAI